MARATGRPKRVVLTGGPGGGKSTFVDALRRDPDEHARWVFVPEVAPLMLRAGLEGASKGFQIAAVQLQIALEDSLSGAAGPDRMLLCDRGTLDCLGYWCRNGWTEAEFFAETMKREAHFDRYDAVLQLRTTVWASHQDNRHWSLAGRPDTVAQAVEIDRMCEAAWRHHPRYFLIECADTWPAKERLARQVLARIIGEPDL